MSKILPEQSNMYGYTIMGVKGEGLDIGGCVLTSPGLTAYDLAKTYEKEITIKVDNKYIGFAGISSAINYICKAEKTKKISEITWWGHERCLYHLKLLFALSKEHADDLLNGDRDAEIFPTLKDKKDYLSRTWGRKHPKSKYKYKITVKKDPNLY
jgi:hypothetical protein